MRILFLGAGATGGFFGVRAHQAGLDVHFLVRDTRARRIQRDGLRLVAQSGTEVIHPKIETAETLQSTYDFVILSCKSYDLETAISVIYPAVGDQTLILPIMNGMAHYDRLDEVFGADKVLGGLCQINATLNENGEIVHLGSFAHFVFGERQGRTPRPPVIALQDALEKATFVSRLSTHIEQDCWEKFVLLSTLAGSTCLMRGSIGSIVSTHYGASFLLQLLKETESIAAASGYPIRHAAYEANHQLFTDPTQPMTASMYRDLVQNLPVEADHIFGDLIRRAHEKGLAVPLLEIAYTHLQVYQSQRRERLRIV